MRPRKLVAVVLVLVAALGATLFWKLRAGGVTAGTVSLPFSPYAHATPHGWVTGIDRATPEPVVITWSVESITGDDVAIRYSDASGDPAQDVNTFSRGRAPTLAKYCHLDDADTITHLEITPERRTVGGHEFACTHVSFRAKNESFSFWLSPEVTVNGLVAFEVSGREETAMKWTIAGFGEGEVVTWGTKAAGRGISPVTSR